MCSLVLNNIFCSPQFTINKAPKKKYKIKHYDLCEDVGRPAQKKNCIVLCDMICLTVQIIELIFFLFT